MPAWDEEMSPEVMRIAELELGETPELRIQSLKDLRRLINDESDFRPQTTDHFLLRFLRTKKFDAKRAFKTLKNYYIFKARYSGLITDFTPKDVASVLEMNNIFVMPQRHPTGPLVTCLRLAHFDIDKVTKEQVVAAGLVGLEYTLQFEVSQVCGYIMILDLSKASMRTLKYWASPAFLFRCIRLLQDCVPCRVKAFHVVNEPFFFNIAFNIIKSFMSEKLVKRVFFHGSNLKSLHQQIPASMLPTELGGEIGPISSHVKDLMARLVDREVSFETLNKYGFHEKKIQRLKKQDTKSVFL